MDQKLKSIWANVLDLDPEEIEDDMTFVHLDGDSVKAIQVVAAAATQDILFSVETLYAFPTIEALSSHLSSSHEMSLQKSPARSLTHIASRESSVTCHSLCSQISTEHRTAPVSPVQEILLRLHENGELHLSVYVYELKEFVDESALRRAVEALTVNHPILRTTWAESNSGYCQVLLPSSAVSFSSFDGCILNHIQQTKAVILTPGQRNARFSLIRDRSRGTTFVTIAIHHAFCDAFTRYLLERDLMRALEAPDDIQRGPPKPWYGDFAQYLKTHQDDEKAFKYWNDYIKGSTTEVACRGPLGPTIREHSTLTNSMAITVPKKHQVGLGAVIVTAWSLALAQHSGLSDFVFKMGKFGRSYPYPGLDQMGGPLLATSLFRFRLTDTDESIQRILRRVQQELASHANYEHGLETLHSSGLPPVQCLVNVKLGTHTMQSTSIGGMTVHPRRDLESWEVQLYTSIYLEVSQELSGISIKMCYRSEHIGHQKAQLLFENFHDILDNIDGEDFGVGQLITKGKLVDNMTCESSCISKVTNPEIS